MVTLVSGNGIIGIFVYVHFSVWILLVARGGFLIQKSSSEGIDIWDRSITINDSNSYEIHLTLGIEDALDVTIGADLHV